MRIRLHGSGGNIAWQQIRICIASSAKSSSPFFLPSDTRQHFPLHSGFKKQTRKFRNRIRPREAALFCRFFSTRNSTDSISKSAIRKCSLSDSYTFLIYYFCEILKGEEFIYLCSLCSICLLASLFSTHLILISNLKLFWIIYKR